MSKLVGLEKHHSEASERLEDIAREKAKQRAEKQAAYHAERQETIRALQKISKVSPERFNEIIAKFGTGDYARSLITRAPFTKDSQHNKTGLW